MLLFRWGLLNYPVTLPIESFVWFVHAWGHWLNRRMYVRPSVSLRVFDCDSYGGGKNRLCAWISLQKLRPPYFFQKRARLTDAHTKYNGHEQCECRCLLPLDSLVKLPKNLNFPRRLNAGRSPGINRADTATNSWCVGGCIWCPCLRDWRFLVTKIIPDSFPDCEDRQIPNVRGYIVRH